MNESKENITVFYLLTWTLAVLPVLTLAFLISLAFRLVFLAVPLTLLSSASFFWKAATAPYKVAFGSEKFEKAVEKQ